MTGDISSSIVATQLAFSSGTLRREKNPAKVIHRSALDDHAPHVTTRLRPRVYAQADEHQREQERRPFAWGTRTGIRLKSGRGAVHRHVSWVG